MLGLTDPEVRLLSIGEEPEKGNQLTIEAHALLADTTEINFAGNAEGRDLLRGAADVVVTDGFTGNIALKLLEGGIRELLDLLREEISATPRGKLGGLLIRPAARRVREQARSGHVRRRLSARPARPGRDLPRQLGATRDRQRDPSRGPRRRAPRRGAVRRAAAAERRPPARLCMIGALRPCQLDPNR